MKNKGFTLIELIVTIAVISVLSGIILFSITQYVAKGKDSNIAGNLTAIIPAGETFYNSSGYTYKDFCSSAAVQNAKNQMPSGTTTICNDQDLTNQYQDWAACAIEFQNNGNYAFCVDSRGMKRNDMPKAKCNTTLYQCP